MSSRLAQVSLLLVLTGCAAIHRPPATRASLEQEAAALRTAEERRTDSVVARLARRALTRGDRTLDILLLSGGGQMGAYGAGFLRGWKGRTDSPMPAFDLVTGISTGSLQAPFALLGTPAALDTVGALYRRAADRIAPTVDWWFWLRRTGGAVNATRFRETIASVVDTAMRRDLQRAFGEGRQLIIGTTDYDLGIGRTWDISQELDTTRASLEHVHALFVTTAAIPGIFPPVVLDGHVHGDGGTISNVLPGLSLEHYVRLGERLEALNVGEPVTVRLWVVMNNWTHAIPKPTNPASRKGITARSNTLLFWAQQSQILQRLTELAHAVNHGVDVLRMEMRYTTVPQVMSAEPGADKLFQGAFMVRLDEVGFERARSTTPWETVPPSPYVRPR